MNRLIRPTARLRKGERKSHFERDYRTVHTLWHDPNVLGFGVGPKISDKNHKSHLCVVFFVRKKLAKKRLRNLAEIPPKLRLNISGKSVQTDVQEWGRIPVAHRALSPGVIIGDRVGDSGTITLAVRDRSNEEPLILGCSHVLAQCGRGSTGDPVESPVDPSHDPGPNIVGQLVRFTIIDPGSLKNAVDAAVAKPVSSVQLANNIPEIGVVSQIRDLTRENADVVTALPVQKFGVATQLQSGTIKNIHVSTSIIYHELPNDPSVDFVELVEYDCVSEGGDSGAAVVDTGDSVRVVGMHIAGTGDGSGSLFTHIRYVFESMGVTM